jgi:hypothetical protein
MMMKKIFFRKHGTMIFGMWALSGSQDLDSRLRTAHTQPLLFKNRCQKVKTVQCTLPVKYRVHVEKMLPWLFVFLK